MQPAIRKEALKLFTVWKQSKDEDEDGAGRMTQSEKRPLLASEAHTILKKVLPEDVTMLGPVSYTHLTLPTKA